MTDPGPLDIAALFIGWSILVAFGLLIGYAVLSSLWKMFEQRRQEQTRKKWMALGHDIVDDMLRREER